MSITAAPTTINPAAAATPQAWHGFDGGEWQNGINVRDFIQRNYTPYLGDGAFLQGPTERTTALWNRLVAMFPAERERGVYDVDEHTPSTITSHAPGYIDRDSELIVGLQTDAPLKRAIMPNGGWRMVEDALVTYGYQPDPQIKKIFTTYRKTHNQGVFDVTRRRSGQPAGRTSSPVCPIPTAAAGSSATTDALPSTASTHWSKPRSWSARNSICCAASRTSFVTVRKTPNRSTRCTSSRKWRSAMASTFPVRPSTAQEAVQWLYFAYLGAVKEQNGAAMSLGRTSTFLDIYLQRDLAAGRITETRAQELIDDLVIKLRIVRFLRTPEYDSLFSGDPTWVTESIGGIGEDGRPLVTRTSFRMLQTLYNLGPAPEPNLTVMWNGRLPTGFKEFCAKVSIDTSAIQYESDDLIRGQFGDDAAIACCVSAMRVGKQMQFFGARVNLAKTLLYAINGGRDEITGQQVAPISAPVGGSVLDYAEVTAAFDHTMDWLAEVYVDALNCVHFMHDKYAYERLEMALHDGTILRTLACGVAGLSVVADSLSAIKYASVHPVRDETGLVVDYLIEGEFPTYGNDDDRADEIAVELVQSFMKKVRRQPSYRGAVHTQSVLTITSNVVYGKATGNTPDGRRAGAPFAPGANPMNGRDTHGMLASALSVAKLPYDEAQDGISLTATVVPAGLGHTPVEQSRNLVGLLDAYIVDKGFHLNVNVLNRETLEDAMEHPEKYPQLTIRVSGYAVNFVRLTREQQLDVLSRTFHGGV